MGALSQFSQSIDWTSLGDMVLRVTAILLCLVVHEVCHGLAAYKLGDPTAKRNHRLSLNPIRHLDIFGLLMMVVVGFGWAKPVPVDPRYFKNSKRGMAITALAGPLSNFVLAYVACILWGSTVGLMDAGVVSVSHQLWMRFLSVLVQMNVGLGIFNLIPFPPLDGSKVVAMFLPDRAYARWMQLERYGMILLMAVLWFGWLDTFLYTARNAMINWLLTGSQFAYHGIAGLWG